MIYSVERQSHKESVQDAETILEIVERHAKESEAGE